MKERPILFSGPMIRALLAGTKTQTRRVVKPQPWASCCIEEGMEGESPFVFSALGGDGPGHDVTETRTPCRCPYGQPGDRLWVRENGWERPHLSARDLREGADTWPRYEYDAEPVMCWDDGELKRLGWKRRPSIHMPRWACRLVLTVASVRVERLQDISEADALAEGIVPTHGGYGLPDGSHFHAADPRVSYWSLWDAINGAGSVEADPWVWAVSFRRLP